MVFPIDTILIGSIGIAGLLCTYAFDFLRLDDTLILQVRTLAVKQTSSRI